MIHVCNRCGIFNADVIVFALVESTCLDDCFPRLIDSFEYICVECLRREYIEFGILEFMGEGVA